MTKKPKPDCAWSLTDLNNVPKVGVKVMSTFSCGGGSSMGYKRAGCEIVAANDIDPDMQWHYVKNVTTPDYYLCPIKDLVTMPLPDKLIGLDILDGSPPCSTFSMAGAREKGWGKEKHFREGQAKQVLSDLFFDFLALVERIKPKVVIAENVKGMLLGNAKGYTKLVVQRLKELGYNTQVFLINAANCGVPQSRERVFFCSARNDLKVKKLVLNPKHRIVTAGEATSDVELTDEDIRETAPTPTMEKYWSLVKKGQSFSSATGGSHFNWARLSDDCPSPTIASSNVRILLHWDQCRSFSYRELLRLSSFPDDYIAKNYRLGGYLMGMSVPPKMAEAVARAVCAQWLGVSYG